MAMAMAMAREKPEPPYKYPSLLPSPNYPCFPLPCKNYDINFSLDRKQWRPLHSSPSSSWLFLLTFSSYSLKIATGSWSVIRPANFRPAYRRFFPVNRSSSRRPILRRRAVCRWRRCWPTIPTVSAPSSITRSCWRASMSLRATPWSFPLPAAARLILPSAPMVLFHSTRKSISLEHITTSFKSLSYVSPAFFSAGASPPTASTDAPPRPYPPPPPPVPTTSNGKSNSCGSSFFF